MEFNLKNLTQSQLKPYSNQKKKYILFSEKDKIRPKKSLVRNEETLIEVYKVGTYSLYYISIYKNFSEYEKKYKVNYFFNNIAEEQYFQNIIEELIKNTKSAKINSIIPIEKLIEIYRKDAFDLLNSKYKIPLQVKEKLSILAAIKKINLEKLFPLLIDDFIEEIFLDSPDDNIYLNHQKYGRCRTDITLNSDEIDRFKTLLRLYSGQRLDIMNPTIKFVIKNEFFYCRFAVDVKPVQLNDFSLDIRKLNKNILTIQDLIKNRTLNSSMASFLYFCVLKRINITVVGETDSGKTTLINALDLLTPKRFRKIYVENATESLDELTFGKHQLKYKADSLNDPTSIKHSKSNQIKKLLHRTPDLIYLGEILTKEEAEAMFHCLSAGLKGFQTIHSNSVDSLINRILYHFKISKACLDDLDLIVLMKKYHNQRRIVSISEICFKDTMEPKVFNIFQYNPRLGNWDNLISLYETKAVNSLKQYEALSKEDFFFVDKIYSDIFEFIRKSSKMENRNLIDLFHKISYFSIHSIDHLKNFWTLTIKQFKDENM